MVTSRDRRPDDTIVLRRTAFALVGILTVGNAGALALLVHELVTGGTGSGRTLITAGGAIWLTNVAVFALWFWELDGAW